MQDDLVYLWRLLRSLARTPQPRRRLAPALPAVALGLGIAVLVYGHVPNLSAAQRARASAAANMQQRALQVADALARVEATYQADVAPIEQVLRTYRDDPVLTRRIAVALVREARRNELPARLLMAVLLVENPWLDPAATSPMGAKGLMQIMPLHRGKWAPCEPRLEDVDANICHGARIFASYLRSEKNHLERALLRYNGCVRGTNTPNCRQYANQVFARAGRASILNWNVVNRPTTP